jgi:putative hydrolase of the HAD superfamily
MNELNETKDRSSPSDPEDLIGRIKRLSSPLEPLPTDSVADIAPLAEIKAVVLDVYGTLFVSASGDIVAAGGSDVQAMVQALVAVGIEPINGSSADQADRCGKLAVELMQQAVVEQHAMDRGQGVDFPEVEIRDIWRRLLDGLAEAGRIDGGQVVSDQTIEALAVEYECRVNPVWPMPNLAETLGKLSAGGSLLGIVSNSQFCTPLMFDALLGQSVGELGFLSDLCAWSYVQRCAKPSVRLYEPVKQRLADRGLKPHQVLYVGNDMRKDIWPAGQLGFKTALFAGDRRSLRLEVAELSSQVRPTVTITQLNQLLEVVGG